ncbi:ABC transporter permease [Mesorhizobium sp.]|nr:ABC transporter permease [Mesorhizobium sp.]RWA97840.1 MAG: ABC transporter permease [Mesorhizobium sp.]
MEFLTDIGQFTDFMASSLRLAVPIAFAALGGVLAERSGVLNIGLEGMMLAGAFGAAIGAFATGSPIIGLACGILMGAVGGLLLGVLAVSWRINQLVAGIAINLLFAGMTSFLARQLFGEEMGRATVEGFGKIAIPGLSAIPIVGPAVFNQDPLTYLLYVLAPVSSWLLFKTSWGLSLRGTGENPRAADSSGVAVFRLRYAALIGSGMLAAIGGAQLVLSQIHLFAENMSAGKGFIALAAVILGRWNPALAILAALFFGMCDAAQLRLQFVNPEIPYQVFLILPYLASIVALVGLVGVVRAPEALGAPYDREGR